MSLTVELTDDRRGFAPGETLTGQVSWDVDNDVTALELRLYYFTEGRGTRDVGLGRVERFDEPSTHDRREFSLTIPSGPYSCSGTLVSLHWALELVALPADTHSEPVRIEIGPDRAAIDLSAIAPFDDSDD